MLNWGPWCWGSPVPLVTYCRSAAMPNPTRHVRSKAHTSDSPHSTCMETEDLKAGLEGSLMQRRITAIDYFHFSVQAGWSRLWPRKLTETGQSIVQVVTVCGKKNNVEPGRVSVWGDSRTRFPIRFEAVWAVSCAAGSIRPMKVHQPKPPPTQKHEDNKFTTQIDGHHKVHTIETLWPSTDNMRLFFL